MKRKIIAFALYYVFVITVCFAQPNDAGLFEPVTDTPVNGGVYAMLIGGALYGIYKINRIKKYNN